MMLIRRMVEADIDPVMRIAEASAPYAAAWTRPQLVDMLAKPFLYSAWVAEEDGIVVGFLYLHTVGDEAELDNLAVSPARRRLGIATGLLRTACEHISERPVSAMFLEVRRSNTAAFRLYQREGFSKSGVRTDYYTNPPEDAIRLEKKRLPPPTNLGQSSPTKF
jgi:ribosomal-protein-alanine N-acetyltransferase